MSGRVESAEQDLESGWGVREFVGSSLQPARRARFKPEDREPRGALGAVQWVAAAAGSTCLNFYGLYERIREDLGELAQRCPENGAPA